MPSPARSLRILTITHNYPRFSGDPAGAFVARLAQGAAAQGHDVEVVAPHAVDAPIDEHSAGVRVHRFRYAPEALERVAYTGSLHGKTLRSPLAALAFPGFLLAFAHAVRTAVRRFTPDVVHAHWWLPAGWFASRGSAPYLITCHGSDVRLLERAPLLKAMALPAFRRAARITAVSRFLAEDIRRLLPALEAEVQVTPMPVDVASFTGARASHTVPPRILFAGNLVPSKGVDVLLQAGGELQRRGVRFELKILGEGPLKSQLQALAQELGIAGRVIWSAFVTQAEMPAEYAAANVTVLPSRGHAEGLGLTLVEALLAGSAVVGTAAGGIPEVIIDQRTGLVARDGDPNDLADQLQRILGNPDLRDRLARSGRDHVLGTYAPDVAIGRFLDLYHAAADAHPHR